VRIVPTKRALLIALAVMIVSACGTDPSPAASTTTLAASRVVTIAGDTSTPAYGTPVEAVLVVAQSDQPGLTAQNINLMQVIYADQTLVDLRVELRAEGFCQWYGVMGFVEGSTLQWHADRALPCGPTG